MEENTNVMDEEIVTTDYEVTPIEDSEESYGISTGAAMLLGGAIVAGGIAAIKFGRKGINWIREKIRDKKEGIVDGDFVDLDFEDEEPEQEKASEEEKTK